jgi:hypothetical protein
MYYSVESVIAALKANDTLAFEGMDEVGCPSPSPSSSVHEASCFGDISKCDDCKNRRCRQRVSVFCNYKRLSVFVFSFAISTQNKGGFIDTNDSTLMQFIRRNLIDKSKLETVVL